MGRSIHKKWESPDRYYTAILHRDLFDTWIVIRVWGGKGSRRGRIAPQPVGSYSAGLQMLDSITRRREQRGYTLVN